MINTWPTTSQCPTITVRIQVEQGRSISMQVLFIILDNIYVPTPTEPLSRWGLARPMNAIKVLVCPREGGGGGGATQCQLYC